LDLEALLNGDIPDDDLNNGGNIIVNDDPSGGEGVWGDITRGGEMAGSRKDANTFEGRSQDIQTTLDDYLGTSGPTQKLRDFVD